MKTYRAAFEDTEIFLTIKSRNVIYYRIGTFEKKWNIDRSIAALLLAVLASDRRKYPVRCYYNRVAAGKRSQEPVFAVQSTKESGRYRAYSRSKNPAIRNILADIQQSSLAAVEAAIQALPIEYPRLFTISFCLKKRV